MIPTYLINIDDIETGMSTISLVDDPAICVDFLKFAEQKLTFANEDKHTIYGPAILCDVPIYRYNPHMGEYNIVFNKETIEKIVTRYSQNKLWNMVNLQHNGNAYVDNVIMTSMFIKNTERGLDPVEFKDVPEGSLFVEFKVTDDELWNQLKNDNKINGFSIEIYADLEKQMMSKETEINKTDDEIIDEFVESLLK